MSETNANESDRREYFRFDDRLTLSLKVLDQETVDTITSDFDTFRQRFCMKSSLQNQSNTRKPQLMRVRSRDVEVATYLEFLERQITQLAERLDQMNGETEDGLEVSGQVNISATGIRFNISIPMEVGHIVEMRMVLSTQNIQIVMLGEVQRSELQANGEYSTSVQYTHIHTEDVEAIVRHLARLQQIKLQAARLDDE